MARSTRVISTSRLISHTSREASHLSVLTFGNRKAEDAQAAVKFANEKNLRLVIKNTGHDYMGRSTGRGGFLLWTHHLKDKLYNATFVPQGASASSIGGSRISRAAHHRWAGTLRLRRASFPGRWPRNVRKRLRRLRWRWVGLLPSNAQFPRIIYTC